MTLKSVIPNLVPRALRVRSSRSWGPWGRGYHDWCTPLGKISLAHFLVIAPTRKSPCFNSVLLSIFVGAKMVSRQWKRLGLLLCQALPTLFRDPSSLQCSRYLFISHTSNFQSANVQVCELDPGLLQKLGKFRMRKETTNAAIVRKYQHKCIGLLLSYLQTISRGHPFVFEQNIIV